MLIKTRPFTIPRWDLTWLAIWNFHTNPTHIIFFAVVTLLAGGSMLLGVQDNLNIFTLFFAIFGVPSAIAFYTCAWAVLFLLFSRAIVVRGLVIDDDSLSLEDEQGNIIKTMLSSYRQVKKVGNYYIVYSEKRQFFPIPRSAFQSRQDIAAVERIFEQRGLIQPHAT